MTNLKPREIKIEVTYKCALSCVHCSSDANPDNNASMNIEKCIEIIDNAVSLGVEEIAFTGGEPFLWDGIIEAIEYSYKMKLRISIYTTGNCDGFSKLLALSSKYISNMIFSVFSDNEYDHNRITRKSDSFYNTLNCIKLVQKHGINTEVHFVALASNYRKLINIAEMVKAIGVNRISVLRFVPQGRGRLISSHDTLNQSQNLELKRTILHLRNIGHDIRTGSPFNVLFLNENPKCMAAQDRLIIAPNLHIYPCDAFKQVSSEIIAPGDLYSNLENHSLIDCWNKSKYFEVVRNVLQSTPKEPCNSCGKYSDCLAGCLAQKYLHYSVIDVNPDPACLQRSVRL